MNNIKICLFLGIILYSCSGKSEGSGGAVIKEINLPEYNLQYVVPYAERSVVAAKENLSEKVAMCVVDTVSDICTVLLRLSYVPSKYEDAENAVMLITEQKNSIINPSVSYDIKPCEFLSEKAWHFDAVISVDDKNEVNFSGYIFRNLVLVVTSPMEEKHLKYDISAYFDSLKIVQ